SGGTTLQLSETAAATASGAGEIRHLAVPVTGTTPAGAYSISITGIDLVSNQANTSGPSFNVRASFSLAGLVLTGAATEVSGSTTFPAVSPVTLKKTITSTMPAPGGVVLGAANLQTTTLTTFSG